MNRNALRDYLRRQRVRKHFAAHGGTFDFHGVSVRLPETADVAAANALIRGKYEQEEAEVILKHLPRDLPVIELGGSLGVISALIRSRLEPAVRHLVVEANPALAQICQENAVAGSSHGTTEIVTAALYYDGPVARLAVSEQVHSSSLAVAGRGERTVEVRAVTLGQLHERIGSPDRFSLVCDIEGAEFDLFARESRVLERIDKAIVELHPRSYASGGHSESELLANAARSGLELVERRSDVVLLARR